MTVRRPNCFPVTLLKRGCVERYGANVVITSCIDKSLAQIV